MSAPAKKRGRPPKGAVTMTQAERSRRSRERVEQEMATRTRALAAALRCLTVRPTDSGADDLLAALGTAVLGVAMDLHIQPGEAGEDAAIRAAVRSLLDAATEQLGDETAGMGALAQALHEIDGSYEPPP